MPVSSKSNAPDEPDVVKVSSHLVPVPATVLDASGVAVPNLKLEDFELTVDGQAKPISEITRTESPVRLAMLFDNSGSLDFARDFEKRAAVRFFHYVLRPMDQAAIYSVSTNIVLSQPMTSDVSRLQQTDRIISQTGRRDLALRCHLRCACLSKTVSGPASNCDRFGRSRYHEPRRTRF
jgi:VWFA-related protein